MPEVLFPDWRSLRRDHRFSEALRFDCDRACSWLRPAYLGSLSRSDEWSHMHDRLMDSLAEALWKQCKARGPGPGSAYHSSRRRRSAPGSGTCRRVTRGRCSALGGGVRRLFPAPPSDELLEFV